MTLLEIYDELFEYLCRLNRASKAPSQPDFERVRSDILELLEKATQKAGSDVRLLNQIRDPERGVELPIVFFIDNLICTSRLNFAAQWADSRLAVRLKNELAGDERFFEFLELELRDPSEEARERLAVYYTCLCLGFTGMYVNSPQKIGAYINQIFPRLSPFMNRNPASRLTEEAYKHTNTTILTEPPSKWLLVLSVVFVFLSLSSLVVYYGLYVNASKDISASVKQLMNLPLK